MPGKKAEFITYSSLDWIHIRAQRGKRVMSLYCGHEQFNATKNEKWLEI